MASCGSQGAHANGAKRSRLSAAEQNRIAHEARIAQATRWPEGDSWIRGYAEDVPKLLAEIDRLKLGFSAHTYSRRTR